MRFNPDSHHRRSIRLKGYDYSQAGAYFVTFVVKGRECLFGAVVDGAMQLGVIGEIVVRCWEAMPRHEPRVELDAFVAMPNHMHAIVVLADREGETVAEPVEGQLIDDTLLDGGKPTSRAPANAAPLPNGPNGTKPGSLGAIVQSFKSVSTRKINQQRGSPGTQVWQRNYYETIVRDERMLLAFRRYVEDNPARWDADQLHPDNPSKW